MMTFLHDYQWYFCVILRIAYKLLLFYTELLDEWGNWGQPPRGRAKWPLHWATYQGKSWERNYTFI